MCVTSTSTDAAMLKQLQLQNGVFPILPNNFKGQV